jgi:transcriptional regulator with XRE-family HTH domain
MKFKTMKEVAVMIKKAREKKGLSLQQAADAAGMSKPHLWELENGKSENPTMVTIVRLSAVLGIRPQSWF